MSLTGTILSECTEVYNILNQAGQYPRLSDANYLLLLDARQRHDYNESHIITAKFVPRNDIGAFTVPHDAELQTMEHVVVYDSNTSLLKDKTFGSTLENLYEAVLWLLLNVWMMNSLKCFKDVTVIPLNM